LSVMRLRVALSPSLLSKALFHSQHLPSFPTRRSSDLFLHILERLKCNTRHGWTSTGRRESVAEHSYRLCAMAFLLRNEFPELDRSEEHTSELQSRFDLVCRLLLEKKKKTTDTNKHIIE